MDWIFFVEKVLADDENSGRKLNTKKTQVVQRSRLRKSTLEKHQEDISQETHWQTNDNIIIPQRDLLRLAKEAEIEGQVFDNHIIYPDP